MARPFKSIFLGDPLANEESQHQRLSNRIALAVFSSDAISSVAYATGEVLIVLSIAGTQFLKWGWPISLAIGALLIIVVSSYRQTVHAYPQGGGSYRVSKENLGTIPGLIAAASLLVGYVLTVAVSISAGTAAIMSAFPALRTAFATLPGGPYNLTVPIALFFVALLSIGNLRGVKESGTIFSAPTYIFIGSMVVMIFVGFFIAATQGVDAIQVKSAGMVVEEATGALTMVLILRAFAAGCSAMTGVEAIADGVQVFREPVSKNAAKTLTWMGGILLTLFLGTTWLAVQAGVQGVETETVISQLAHQFFQGGWSWFYYVISFATMGILVVGANTAYADFPRLSSFLAADDFLPHQMKDRGYRLVHSNGINLLTTAAVALIILFKGNTTALIPLYGIGVFVSFTLSQAGMVRRWFRLRNSPHWRRSAAFNTIGAITTAAVALIIAVVRFREGAWIVIVVVPVLVSVFLWIRHRYSLVHSELALPESEIINLNWQAHNQFHNHVIVLVRAVDRRLVRALQYAKTLRADSVEALFVDVTGEEADAVRKAWDQADVGVKLKIIDSPFRELIGPVIDYVRGFPRPSKDHVVTVIIPEYAPNNAAEAVLHDQTPFWIKRQLFGEEGVIVTDVPYHPSFDEDTRRAAVQARHGAE